jgi:hypothetical protein
VNPSTTKSAVGPTTGQAILTLSLEIPKHYLPGTSQVINTKGVSPSDFADVLHSIGWGCSWAASIPAFGADAPGRGEFVAELA